MQSADQKAKAGDVSSNCSNQLAPSLFVPAVLNHRASTSQSSHPESC